MITFVYVFTYIYTYIYIYVCVFMYSHIHIQAELEEEEAWQPVALAMQHGVVLFDWKHKQLAWCNVSASTGLTNRCGTVCCSELQYVAVCCSVLQYGAVCCSVLQCVAVQRLFFY